MYSLAYCKACALILGGRIPYNLGEVKALRMEAYEASKRAKKYMSRMILTNYQQQVVDGVGRKGLFLLKVSED